MFILPNIYFTKLYSTIGLLGSGQHSHLIAICWNTATIVKICPLTRPVLETLVSRASALKKWWVKQCQAVDLRILMRWRPTSRWTSRLGQGSEMPMQDRWQSALCDILIFCQTHTLSSPESTTQHPPHHQYHQWFIMASFSSLMAKTRQRWQLLWALCRFSVYWQCLSQTHWQTHCKLWIISWISWLLSWIGIGKVVKRWWYRGLFGLLAELNFVGDNGDIVIIINIIIHIQTVALFTDI